MCYDRYNNVKMLLSKNMALNISSPVMCDGHINMIMNNNNDYTSLLLASNGDKEIYIGSHV